MARWSEDESRGPLVLVGRQYMIEEYHRYILGTIR